MAYMGSGYLPGQTGFTDGGTDWEKLFSMMKGPNPLVMAGINAGSGILGGLADLIGGESWGEKQGKRLYRQLESMKGQPMISPSVMNMLQPKMQSGMTDYVNQLGIGASRKSGLESGQATGEILRGAAPQMNQQLANILWQIIQQNAQAPLEISRLQAGIASGLR